MILLTLSPSMGIARASGRVLRATTLVASFAALSLAASPASAQRAERVPTDSLVRQALQRSHFGDTAAALDLLHRATDQSPRDPEALYWRGVILARTSFIRVGDIPRNFLAWRLLDRAAEIDPKNPRYLLEIGRVRLNQPLLRIEAERMFRKALKVAEENGNPEQLAEVTWELGQVKERRYRSSRNRYMITTPGLLFDPAQGMAQRRYVQEFLTMHSRPIESIGSVDRTEAEEYYRRGLRASPTHEPNAIGLLGLLYDQKRYQEMREVARPFIDAGTGSARLRLAAGLAAYRLGEAQAAERAFDDALSRFTAADRADATNLSRIIRRREAIAYEALSERDRAQTDSAYWEAADPLLSTPQNEGRLEFLARLAIADLRYTDDDMRQTGWRTDRGLILIRYGEPPVEASFAPTTSGDAGDAVGRIVTVWWWPGKEERQWVFVGPPAMNIASFAGDYRGYAEEEREKAAFLLDNVALAAAIDTLPIQIARFRGRTPEQTQLVVAASVRTSNLYDSVEIDASRLALSLRIGPPSAMRLTDADTVPVTLPVRGDTRRVWTRTVPAGRTRVRVEAVDGTVKGAARSQQEFEVKRAAVGALEISDVLLAEKRDAPATPLRNFAESGIVPRGDVTVAQREVFNLYWENYGLRPDPDGRVRMKLQVRITLLEIDRADRNRAARILGAIADAVNVTKEGEQQLGLRFDREEPLGDRDRVPQTVTIGLGTSPPGLYRLELIVTDPSTGSTARTEREFHVTRQ